jgi:hypothetical protein
MQELHYFLMEQHCFYAAWRTGGDFLTFVLPVLQMAQMVGLLTHSQL